MNEPIEITLKPPEGPTSDEKFKSIGAKVREAADLAKSFGFEYLARHLEDEARVIETPMPPSVALRCP